MRFRVRLGRSLQTPLFPTRVDEDGNNYISDARVGRQARGSRVVVVRSCFSPPGKREQNEPARPSKTTCFITTVIVFNLYRILEIGTHTGRRPHATGRPHLSRTSATYTYLHEVFVRTTRDDLYGCRYDYADLPRPNTGLFVDDVGERR